MGELMAVAVREDQRLCGVCGTFYTKEDRICPNLFEAARGWYLDPTPICHKDQSLFPELVREEIERFLRKKVKRAVLETVVKTNPA